jgi:predicted nucleic acid-binding Zn ribbon protein
MTDQHKHCPMCQKPIPLSEKFCSPNCEQIYKVNQQKIEKTRKMLYIAFAVFIVLFLLLTFRSKIGF